MINAKSASLLAGIVQQAALVLIIRFSKTQREADAVGYLTSVAVASSEVFKMCLSYILEVNTQEKPENAKTQKNLKETTVFLGGSTGSGREGYIPTLFRMLSVTNKESAKLIVPAALYLAQNNLLFVALSNLSVPVYQVSNQGKLLTTALISRVLLNKKISALQYFAISLLGLGVAVIHLSEYWANHAEVTVTTEEEEKLNEQNQILGLIAVLVSCFTSGFSGVYFELILKHSKVKQSLHIKNFQLALWSLLFAICLIFSKDGSKVMEYGLFQGFDWIVILVVVNQGLTGFVVSLMLKYADAVLKGFAIAVAAVVSTIVSMLLFGTKVDASFVIGASMVMLAVKLYSFEKPNQKSGESENKIDSSYHKVGEEGENDEEEGKKLIEMTAK